MPPLPPPRSSPKRRRQWQRPLGGRITRGIRSGAVVDYRAVHSRSPGTLRMAGIFVSYRRDDAAAYAGRLHADLARRFGRDRVFMDITAIEPGVPFATALDRAVTTCDVFLAV